MTGARAGISSLALWILDRGFVQKMTDFRVHFESLETLRSLKVLRTFYQASFWRYCFELLERSSEMVYWKILL